MRYRLYIDGTERSEYIVQGTLRINDELDKQTNSAIFEMSDDTGALTLPERAEVVITDAVGIVTGTKYFGGYAVIQSLTAEAGVRKHWVATCAGWENLLDGVFLAKSYANQRTDQIVTDLFGITALGLGAFDASTYVSIGHAVERIRFRYLRVREVLDNLARIDGYSWWIDPDKALHYGPAGSDAAPFGISDAPDDVATFAARQLTYQKDSSAPLTRVFVQGGYTLSGDQTLEFPGTGQQVVFSVGYRFHANTAESAVVVEKNTGSDGAPTWTGQSVGIENIHSLTGDGGDKDVLYDFQSRTMRFDVAPSDLKRAWRVKAQFERRLLVQVIDAAALATYGRHFDDKIQDTALTQQALAIARAQVLLASRNRAREFGTFMVDQPGLVAGQTVHITNAARGIDGDFVVRRVEHTMLPDSADLSHYRVTYGDHNPRLEHWMLEVNRLLQPQIQSDEDETLNVFLAYIIRNLTVSAVAWDFDGVLAGTRIYDEGKYGYGTYA